MIRFALRSLGARRRRAGMTLLAVLLGVAMIAGTFVFTDTINSAFRQLFGSATTGADAIVSSRQDISSPFNAPATMPAALVTRIGALPGVSVAAGQVQDTATIVGRNGKAIQSRGAPTFALSYLPPPFTGLRIVAGRPPRGPLDVAIDEDTARRQHYRVGDLVPIVTGEPVRRFRVSAIARLGRASQGGATFAVFTLDAAQTLYGKHGRVDAVFVQAAPGTTPAGLVSQIRPLLSRELVVRTAAGQVDNDVRRIGSRLAVLTDGLLAFAFIAVFVGAFVIFNTFSITVAQRSREFALVRALGASRRQVLRSVLTEAAAVGALGSALGLGAGIGAAAAIRALLRAVGFDLPSTALALEARTVIVCVLVGVLVTLAAGLLPATRATRVAPLEALRESAVAEAPSGGWFAGAVAAVTLVVTGAALIVASSGSTGQRVLTSGAGVVMLLVAVVIITPRAVRRATRTFGWPLERADGMIGRLARENAARNPGRTAVTASSLMIGLALVLFVTVYAAGLRSSSSHIIDRTLLGDFTIESTDGLSPIPAASARAAALVPGVETVSGLKSATARLGSESQLSVTAIDPATIAQVYRFEWVHGSDATLALLGPRDVLVERDTAARTGVTVGTHVLMVTETGVHTHVTVRGIYHDQALLSGFAMARSGFDQLFHQPRLQAVLVRLAPGSDRAEAASVLKQALSSLPGVTARSQSQLKSEVAGRVNSILFLFYALLAMSVLMSLLGLVNTLSLSIHERTRELGLLRAVGMTPEQVRRLVRDESVITASIGTVAGIVLGLVFAWVMTRALSMEGVTFSVPWVQVTVLVAVGLLAGVVAAVAPARRAARLDVLAAIAYE